MMTVKIRFKLLFSNWKNKAFKNSHFRVSMSLNENESNGATKTRRNQLATTTISGWLRNLWERLLFRIAANNPLLKRHQTTTTTHYLLHIRHSSLFIASDLLNRSYLTLYRSRIVIHIYVYAYRVYIIHTHCRCRSSFCLFGSVRIPMRLVCARILHWFDSDSGGVSQFQSCGSRKWERFLGPWHLDRYSTIAPWSTA